MTRYIIAIGLLPSLFNAATTSSGQTRWSAPVIVQLRPVTIATERIVDIRTVATITGGSYDMRRRIEQLDIAERPSIESSERVTNSRVAIRIRLAGIAAELYEVRGDETIVTSETASVPTRQTVLNDIHAELCARLSVPPEELEVAFVQATVPAWEEYANRPDVRFTPILPATPRVGEQRITLSVVDGNQPLKTLPVTVDIRLKRPIPVASRSIARDEFLSSDNVRFEIQAVAHGQLSRLPNSVFGQRAARPIQFGKSIETADLKSTRLHQDNQKLIKRRDTVRMVARRGALQVIVANGEALEDGKLNEFINVRNPTSRKVVRGRVSGPSEVEVPF